jgi:hypothetical protein
VVEDGVLIDIAGYVAQESVKHDGADSIFVRFLRGRKRMVRQAKGSAQLHTGKRRCRLTRARLRSI